MTAARAARAKWRSMAPPYHGAFDLAGRRGQTWGIQGDPMPSNLDEQFQTLHEIARAARRNLADGPWDYMMGGAETETTLRRNRMAIDSLAFRPRVLRNVSKVDVSSTFLGRPVRIPVMLAPVGSFESFHPRAGATAGQASPPFRPPALPPAPSHPRPPPAA